MKKYLLTYLLLFFCSVTCAQSSLLWKFSTGSAIYSSAAIYENKLFFGSSDGHLYAVDKKTGGPLWKFKTQGQVNSTPFLFENKVLFNSTDGNIYSVDIQTGKLHWKFGTNGEQRYDIWDYYLSSPVVDKGTVYVGSGDSTVYAIEAVSGNIVWSYKTKGIVHATPVIKDEVLYIGSFDGFLYALDPKSGEEIWKFKTIGDSYFPNGEIQTAVAVFKNTVIFGSRDYNIYALDAKDGTGKWNMKERDSWIIATPMVYNDRIYFGTSDTHRFYCMNANSGEILWNFPLNMRVYGTANLIDGKIAFGCFNGMVYFVDPETGHNQFVFQTEESKKGYYSIFNTDDSFRHDFNLYGDDNLEAEKRILALGSILSNPLVEDNVIFFGDTNGHFYALSYGKQ